MCILQRFCCWYLFSEVQISKLDNYNYRRILALPPIHATQQHPLTSSPISKRLGFFFSLFPLLLRPLFLFLSFLQKKMNFFIEVQASYHRPSLLLLLFRLSLQKEAHTHTSFFYFYYSNIPMPRADNLVLTLNMYKHLEIEELSIIYKRNPVYISGI